MLQDQSLFNSLPFYFTLMRYDQEVAKWNDKTYGS